MPKRDWERHALALDMYLSGVRQVDIAIAMGVTRERARQMVTFAAKQLAFRVFKGVPRPLPEPRWILDWQRVRRAQGVIR